jgi:hypothetical protein
MEASVDAQATPRQRVLGLAHQGWGGLRLALTSVVLRGAFADGGPLGDHDVTGGHAGLQGAAGADLHHRGSAQLAAYMNRLHRPGGAIGTGVQHRHVLVAAQVELGEAQLPHVVQQGQALAVAFLAPP